MRQIILDTETTGLSPEQGDRLVDFAGLEMIDRRLTGRHLHLYVHPERDMPAEAAAVHGLSIAVLEEKNAPPFAAVGQQIADFLRGAELIAHNAPFDMGFLNMEFVRMGLPPADSLAAKVTDTLAMAKAQYPGQKNSLDALCARLDVDRSRRVLHGALIDCELLAEVYLNMTRSQFSLVDELMAAPDAGARPAVTPGTSVARVPLTVLAANEQELAAHAAYLAELDTLAGGACAWRRYPAPGEQEQA